MGKNKKRKSSLGSAADAPGTAAANQGRKPENGTFPSANATSSENNPLYTEQESFLSSLSKQERDYYFSPGTSPSSFSITPERRAEIWTEQADIGEGLINRYAWATPTEECLRIFRAFSPIVEIGSGSNAYWAKYIRQAGIDVVAYDMNVREGGKILHSKTGKTQKKRKQSNRDDGVNESSKLILRKGGPEVLKRSELKNRTLFLCYPDEEDAPMPPDDNSEDEEEERPLSFGWQCLNQYKGTYVIHVGELAFFDATLNMEQSPWGRSSSAEFQQRLASEFHCIAKIQLPNWLHVRDSITVWKRSEICQMAFVGDDDDESEEIIEYRHIPPEELLPANVMAPCMSKLLGSAEPAKAKKTKGKERSMDSGEGKEETEKYDADQKSTPSVKSKAPSNDEDLSPEGDQAELESSNKKTKRGKRREKQKQKKIMANQLAPEDGDKSNPKNTKEEKKIRSEYFRLHGKLPPPS